MMSKSLLMALLALRKSEPLNVPKTEFSWKVMEFSEGKAARWL
jgi:hypothetical protein